MSIHIIHGNGSPITNNIPGTPGQHYIDDATGDQYLYGTTAWQAVGAGGINWSVASIDAAANGTIVLDFTQTQLHVTGVPSTAPLILDTHLLDPLFFASKVGQLEVMCDGSYTVQLGTAGTNYRGGYKVALLGGCTMTGKVISPPTGGSMILRFVSSGVNPALFITAIGVTASTLANA